MDLANTVEHNHPYTLGEQRDSPMFMRAILSCLLVDVTIPRHSIDWSVQNLRTKLHTAHTYANTVNDKLTYLNWGLNVIVHTTCTNCLNQRGVYEESMHYQVYPEGDTFTIMPSSSTFFYHRSPNVQCSGCSTECDSIVHTTVIGPKPFMQV
jgi:hypothetical protein